MWRTAQSSASSSAAFSGFSSAWRPTPVPQPGILDIDPYVPGESTTPGGIKPIKLSSNETPLGPSPLAVAAFKAEADHLERYPDGGATALRKALGVADCLSGDPVESNFPADFEIDVLRLDGSDFRVDEAGPLLGTLEPRCSQEFATWLLVERQRIAVPAENGARSGGFLPEAPAQRVVGVAGGAALAIGAAAVAGDQALVGVPVELQQAIAILAAGQVAGAVEAVAGTFVFAAALPVGVATALTTGDAGGEPIAGRVVEEALDAALEIGVGQDPAHRTGDRQLRPKPDGDDGDPSHRGKKRPSATNMRRYWIGDVALRCANAT